MHQRRLRAAAAILQALLGTLYSCAVEERRNFNPQENYNRIQYFSGSSGTNENASHKVTRSSSCSYGQLEKPIDGKDLEYPWKVLAENVHRQIEAVRTICQTVSRWRTGNGIGHGSDKRNVWLSFLGPDKVGKRKFAASFAETIFGRKEHLLSVDLGTQFEIRACNSVFDHHDSKYFDLKFGRKIIVGYIAKELSKQTRSVMVQILAADRENAVDHWIEQVLCSSLMEAHQRCHANGDSVMKLVACEGGGVEEQFSGGVEEKLGIKLEKMQRKGGKKEHN
ncbi:unnamed protein product [Fraxinus pennsylvanica]|uniref:SMAX1-like AAA+ ATPase lid domain-containing protein n=1 Tax=Fraxinus pennsylvanica TaxID=56036 RepID=A0AAD2DRN4_9LAMI|nr:unnamed protein product [Fraxinus pennsylvanica]